MATKLAPRLPPSTLNKHQQKTEITRARLIKAARRIFARDGFQAASIEEIASEAGHTRGAFYAHFESKEELFFALLEQQLKGHIEELRVTLERCQDPEDRLKVFRDYYVRRARDRQLVVLLLEFKLFALRAGKLRAKWAATLSRIRSALKMELSQSLLVYNCPDATENQKLALELIRNGIVLEHAYDPKRISEEDMHSLLRYVFDLLLPPGSFSAKTAPR